MKVCTVTECDRPSYCKGLCTRHYQASRAAITRDRHNAYQREYRRLNVTRVRAWEAASYVRNRKAKRLQRAAYYVRTKEQRQATIRAYYVAHPEVIKRIKRQWELANKDKTREKNRRWRLANYSAARAREDAWKRNNREAVRAIDSTRRARAKGAEGKHTAVEVLALLKKQRGQCAVCQAKLAKRYHKDHIIPLSAGGPNWITNIQLLCQSCNLLKSAKDPIKFMQERGFLL